MTNIDSREMSRPAIRKDPLPQAGDSLKEERDELLFERVLPWLVISVMGGLWAVLEWWRYLGHVPVTLGGAVGTSVAAAIVVVITAIKVRRAFRVVETIKQGIRGEVHVSQYLRSTCVPLGYRMFDDVPAEGSGGKFNIDHVLIGPGGVFSIETKNWELPGKGTTAFMTYDAKTGMLTGADGKGHGEAVKQAKANGDYLRKELAKRTGRAAVFVRPVLILPGWYVKDGTPRPRPIWILGNETLHQWLEEEEVRLTETEIAALAAELENYVRNFGK